MLLTEGGGEMAALLAVNAVLSCQNIMETYTDCVVVSTGKRGNGGTGSSYYSTVTSQWY